MSKFAQVAIPPLLDPFTYALPESQDTEITVGTSVSVPLGRRKAQGFVIDTLEELDEESKKFTIKQIAPDKKPRQIFSPKDLTFYRWVADYYAESIANVIDVAVPALVPEKKEKFVTLLPEGKDALVSGTKLGSKQEEILKILSRTSEPIHYKVLTSSLSGVSAPLKALEKKGFVQVEVRDLFTEPHQSKDEASWARTEVELNAGQLQATKAILHSVDQRSFHPFLLHGVTGSGKTEVYIEVIQETLRKGMGALVIVPEIALTPQLVDRFVARLGSKIAVLHSGLSKRVRWESWNALLKGEVHLAIGARSAVFAPVKNLGVIIVDEEHDGSYKQSEGFRYNARDCAVIRSKLSGIPVVLGSATPSLESYYNAHEKRYTYLTLPSRHSKTKNSIELIDLNQKKPWDMKAPHLSKELFTGIEETLREGAQVFILYNRRGFASYLQCDSCENSLECPNCSVTLTYHQSRNALRCHYCNYHAIPPKLCPHCQSQGAKEPGALVHRGAGTEKVYDELKELFPEATIDRLDRDVANDHLQYREILGRVRSLETNILIGTQMIAKGHDLPGVQLVGIVDCDVGLHMPDFRAGERIFQLLTQAAGRAGRGDKPGRVILQTRVPKHPSLQKTLSEDYIGFSAGELRSRKALRYPPFVRMLRIVVSSEESQLALDVITSASDAIRNFASGEKNLQSQLRVLGPTPAPLHKLRTHWRWHILIKSNTSQPLRQIISALKRNLNYNKTKVRVAYDLDPQDVL